MHHVEVPSGAGAHKDLVIWRSNIRKTCRGAAPGGRRALAWDGCRDRRDTASDCRVLGRCRGVKDRSGKYDRGDQRRVQGKEYRELHSGPKRKRLEGRVAAWAHGPLDHVSGFAAAVPLDHVACLLRHLVCPLLVLPCETSFASGSRQNLAETRHTQIEATRIPRSPGRLTT